LKPDVIEIANHPESTETIVDKLISMATKDDEDDEHDDFLSASEGESDDEKMAQWCESELGKEGASGENDSHIPSHTTQRSDGAETDKSSIDQCNTSFEDRLAPEASTEGGGSKSDDKKKDEGATGVSGGGGDANSSTETEKKKSKEEEEEEKRREEEDALTEDERQVRLFKTNYKVCRFVCCFFCVFFQ
jgi:hypothetical protein